MPGNETISAALSSAWDNCQTLAGGENADYIPALASVDPDLFGISITTTDGEVFQIGDSTAEFAIESISKVFTMALAMEEIGAKEFRKKVGTDPTGLPFNSVMALALHGGKPMSALVNAGAMSSTSLVPGRDAEDRWRKILAMQSAFAGRPIALSDEVNTSEQTSNFHNRGIAWLLYSGGFVYSDPMEACDVYTRQCSTMITTNDLAAMGATLAAGGVNPLTGERVISSENVPHILAEMTMEGLYEASGDWAYTVGLPGKSGVGGGIVCIVPGMLAIAAFSPRLNQFGNSVRAQAAITHIAQSLKLNLYLGNEDSRTPEQHLVGSNTAKEPLLSRPQ